MDATKKQWIFNNHIGSLIREMRIQKGLTQAQLGEKCGMADSAIRRYESNRGNPKYETLKRIADALGVNVLYFLDAASIPQDAPVTEECDRDLLRRIQNGFESAGDFYNALYRGEIVLALMRDHFGKMLLYAFEQLNDEGQQKAVERVNELTEIPKYQKTAPDENPKP